MKEVNLYIEMDKTAFQKIERKCGYVLEYITPKGETETREGYRKNRSTYNFGVSLSSEDNILTLSTCTNIGEGRTVVHAKLTEIKE